MIFLTGIMTIHDKIGISHFDIGWEAQPGRKLSKVMEWIEDKKDVYMLPKYKVFTNVAILERITKQERERVSGLVKSRNLNYVPSDKGGYGYNCKVFVYNVLLMMQCVCNNPKCTHSVAECMQKLAPKLLPPKPLK